DLGGTRGRAHGDSSSAAARRRGGSRHPTPPLRSDPARASGGDPARGFCQSVAERAEGADVATTAPEYPQIDLYCDDVPERHALLADLRRRPAVAPVRYHQHTAWLITRYQDVLDALSDDEIFPSAAAYLRHSGPVMGKTIQCMAGQEHRRNRALVSSAFRPKLMRSFVESFLTPVAHQLVHALSARAH